MWFVFTDPMWWVAIAATNVGVRNVLDDARVSTAVANSEAPIVAEGLRMLAEADPAGAAKT